MYWCKRYLTVIAALLLLSIISCKRDSKAGTDTMKFFDLKGYFSSEAARLSKLNPEINKTAVYNKQSETKKVHITNWANELSMFSESDINKPAWRANYSIQSSDTLVRYKAKDTTLRTQLIAIKKKGGKIIWIFIYNHIHNKLFNMHLYETKENLIYSPDSYYRIIKRQSARVLGITTFDVTGKFN